MKMMSSGSIWVKVEGRWVLWIARNPWVWSLGMCACSISCMWVRKSKEREGSERSERRRGEVVGGAEGDGQ